ncbi:nadp-dependent d-sorbitol-6-phosphate dehydrogenase [Quercus suber]|uniref:Nadp-dependent d-sorbitol-6-phosphate dehydrogenase n=1 Tax=Quercus suber TaxID=58331 RepID=A0AAW0M0M0_QUESU
MGQFGGPEEMAITLNNCFQMPIIGLVVWRMEKNEMRDLIINAIKIGYRHFDCAGNLHSSLVSYCTLTTRMKQNLGRHLQKHFGLGLSRGKIFSLPPRPIWNSDYGHVVEACKDSLTKLQLDYLDLYLVHFPIATSHTGVGTTASALDENKKLDIDTTISLETTWHDMEDLVFMGLVRSIGIRCNWPIAS